MKFRGGVNRFRRRQFRWRWLPRVVKQHEQRHPDHGQQHGEDDWFARGFRHKLFWPTQLVGMQLHPVAVFLPRLLGGGEGRGEEADYFQNKISSPQPSPRLGGERELATVSRCIHSKTQRVLDGDFPPRPSASLRFSSFTKSPSHPDARVLPSVDFFPARRRS